MTVQPYTARSLPKMEKKLALMTGEELYELGDTGRSELIEGRLVNMAPIKSKHGKLEYRIAKVIGEFVEENQLGEIQVGEVGIYTHRAPDTIRAADILYISHERLAEATPDSFLDIPPELIVEILSPGDRWGEMKRKLREYFEIGVNVVLIVDPDENTITVYHSLTEIRELTEGDELTLENILPGFRAPLADIFG